MPVAGVGNDIFSGLVTIDRSLIQFGALADIMKFNEAQYGWHSLRGAVINSIDDEGNQNFIKDSKEKIDAIPGFEPFAWFFREHAREGFPDDITFVYHNILDDRYLPHTEHDRAQITARLSDNKKGSLSDELIVRAILAGVPPPPPPPPPVSGTGPGTFVPVDPVQFTGTPERVTMRQLARFLKRDADDKFVDYLFQGPRTLNQDGRHYDVTPPAGGGKFGRLGNVLINSLPTKAGQSEDGDAYCYASIRDDAHIGYITKGTDEVGDYYGRIFYTLTPDLTSALEPTTGTLFKVSLSIDPAVANTDTELNRETVNWRSWFRIPGFYYTPSGGEVTTHKWAITDCDLDMTDGIVEFDTAQQDEIRFLNAVVVNGGTNYYRCSMGIEDAGGTPTLAFMIPDNANYNFAFQVHTTADLAVRSDVVTIARDGHLATIDDLEVAAAGSMLFGVDDTIGSWQIMRSGNDLLIQRYELLLGMPQWVTKSTISA